MIYTNKFSNTIIIKMVNDIPFKQVKEKVEQVYDINPDFFKALGEL